MMFLPRALSAIADARIALARLSRTFHAPLREGEPFVINKEQELAIWAKGAEWVWEVGINPEAAEKDCKKTAKERRKVEKDGEKEITERKAEQEKEDDPEPEPFALKDISLSVPRRTLAALVGRVGSGKSSLLQGLIGEMRTTGGKWAFGGSVAYCPQSAWIQNATLVSTRLDRSS
jgi:ABC-type glutathione transport system ATPase component